MKNMLLVCCLCISVCSFAQKEEYLIKISGDTLFGKDFKLNKKTFSYKDLSGTKKEIAATDIRNIRSSDYKGSVVFSGILHRYTDDLTVLQKDFDAAAQSDTAMILTEEYLGPKMNLYQGKDTWGSLYYFYQQPSDPMPVQLVVRYMLGGGVGSAGIERRRTETDTHINEMKGYANQLRAIMGDCSKFNESTWESMTYRIYSIKWVIKKFNSCK